MLTKEMIKEAQELVKNWNPIDDEGIYLGDSDDVMVERVPEWADSWTWIDSVDLRDLFDAFEYYYGTPAKGETFEDLLAQTQGYDFVIEDLSEVPEEIYMLSDAIMHIDNFD